MKASRRSFVQIGSLAALVFACGAPAHVCLASDADRPGEVPEELSVTYSDAPSWDEAFRRFIKGSDYYYVIEKLLLSRGYSPDSRFMELCLRDLDGDGIPELLISEGYNGSAAYAVFGYADGVVSLRGEVGDGDLFETAEPGYGVFSYSGRKTYVWLDFYYADGDTIRSVNLYYAGGGIEPYEEKHYEDADLATLIGYLTPIETIPLDDAMEEPWEYVLTSYEMSRASSISPHARGLLDMPYSFYAGFGLEAFFTHAGLYFLELGAIDATFRGSSGAYAGEYVLNSDTCVSYVTGSALAILGIEDRSYTLDELVAFLRADALISSVVLEDYTWNGNAGLGEIGDMSCKLVVTYTNGKCYLLQIVTSEDDLSIEPAADTELRYFEGSPEDIAGSDVAEV